jgi:calcineurin-like phosphoesterase
VLGTHTHVPTADLSLLPGGTAYVTDVGMTGCNDSIIGFEREDFLALFLGDWRGISVATCGPVVFNAALVEFDLDASRAVGVEAVQRVWKP